MIIVIRIQKSQSIGEIMFEVNNENKKFHNFLRNEKFYKWTCTFFGVLLIFASLCIHFKYFQNKDWMRWENIIMMDVPIGFHLITLAILLCHLNKYHNY